jgi:NAD(P)-dependent dehydrogenase (short-subunit alcohol dehydrogenase family)
VVVAADPVRGRLLEGLVAAGWSTASVDTGAAPGSSEATLAAALAEAAGGRVDLVVAAHLDPASVDARTVTDLDDDAWIDGVEGTLDVARWVARQVAAPLAASKGTLVFVVPSVGLVGAAGHVAVATAAEGVRGWAKSLAKQWAADGVAVHATAVALAHFTDSDVGFPEQVPSLTGPALGSVGDVAADLAPVVSTLAHDDLHFLTGSTLVVDGGLYMGL